MSDELARPFIAHRSSLIVRPCYSAAPLRTPNRNDDITRVLCGAALTLLLFGCAAEERTPPPAADTAPTTASSAAATATGTTVAEPQASETAEPVPADHDVTGSYFPIEALPADFAELEHLLLATIDENSAPAPLNGFLRPKARSADDYTLVNPSLAGRRLTFETTSNGGVQYAFDGQFAVLGNFPANPPEYETAVLSGTLRRIRNGQTVASTPVRFRYEAGG